MVRLMTVPPLHVAYGPHRIAAWTDKSASTRVPSQDRIFRCPGGRLALKACRSGGIPEFAAKAKLGRALCWFLINFQWSLGYLDVER